MKNLLSLSFTALFIFCSFSGFCQIGLQAEQIDVLKEVNLDLPKSFKKQSDSFITLNFLKPNFHNPTPRTHLPNTFSANDLAFFCRIELNIEQTIKFPFKFRLGEVQQVEALEQKHPTSRLKY